MKKTILQKLCFIGLVIGMCLGFARQENLYAKEVRLEGAEKQSSITGEYSQNDIKYVYDGGQNVYYVSSAPEVQNAKILSQVNGIPVTYIADWAFAGNDALVSVKIPSTITKIGDGAFDNCRKLEELEIPDSVKEIGYSAFTSCVGIKKMTLPGSIEKIGESAFYDVKVSLKELTVASTEVNWEALKVLHNFETVPLRLEKVTVTKGDAYIGKEAFGTYYLEDDRDNFIDSSTLKSVNIEEGVKGIDDGAFACCTGLKEIKLPSTITYIGKNAFFRCSGLTQIELPEALTALGEGAFRQCTNLNGTIVLPKGICSIPNRAFFYCKKITGVKTEGSITSIGEQAFEHCTKLSTIPSLNNVKKIRTSAFAECSSISGKLNLPEGISVIEERAFYQCSGIKEIVFPKSLRVIEPEAFMGCTGIKEVILSEGVTSIWDSAFEGCIGIKSVSIPSTVSGLGEGTFKGCKRLEGIVVPKKVKEIPDECFRDCTSLKNLSLPTELDLVGKQAFYNCKNLTMVVLGVEDVIGYEAFGKCDKIKKVYWLGKNTDISYDSAVFSGKPTVYYPKKNKMWDTYERDYKNQVSFGQWVPYTEKSYKITYKLSGGKNNKKNPKSYQTTSAGLQLIPPVKSGYTFVGWYTDKKCTKKVTAIYQGSTGNKTFYAKWKKNTK